ncbi:MAG TPA: ATP-binding cassette domain-containing protein, partial [Candidatus Sulfotelmatobacter sp.]|nr:ATP-binding cassette domain-containing protein [Candidatus Sulfotelmatobacter sp.]
MSPAADGRVARLRDVAKTYEVGAVAVPALKSISLDVTSQRFTMIVGPSGSGKTTLLNLIGCIDAPTSGAVEVCGQAIADLSDNAVADFRARHIGFIFQ